MRIAFASGKGGVGKTTLTANLAQVWPRDCALCDADVETPSLHLLLKPMINISQDITLEVVTAVTDSCVACGDCRSFCRYGALGRLGNRTVVFSDKCYGCGGCWQICEFQALVKGERILGTIHEGVLATGASFFSGTATVGEIFIQPLVQKLLAALPKVEEDILLDCPKGLGPEVFEVAKNTQAMVLVVEPSPLGLANFKLSFKALASHVLGCVLMRTGIPDHATSEADVLAYCAEENIPVFGLVPFEREAYAKIARGELLALTEPYKAIFCQIAQNIYDQLEVQRA